LFVGTRCIAVVEAKRKNKNVSAFVDQAQRYSRWFRFEGGAEAIAGPWAETDESTFLVPFVFSANGRPYLKQVETQSGIWFRDARKPSNHRRALVDWPTPEGLQGLLEIDAEAAQADLKSRPIEFATTRIVSAKTFGDIFGLKGLDTAKPDSETKVHICTIQGLVKRVLCSLATALVPRSLRINTLAEFDKDRSPAIASVNRGDPTPHVSETH
jgi:hypothetical protein